MKRILLFVLLALSVASVSAQQNVKEMVPSFTQSPQARFRLYPTQNTFYFMELDTRTGRIWAVQYTTRGYQTRTDVSSTRYADDKPANDGRFTLYATANMSNFILVDQTDGRTWLVQWSAEGRGNKLYSIGSGSLL